MMIANEKNLALNQGATIEEEELQKRASAPTVLDLRAAFKDLFADLETIVEAERDSNSPKDRPPQHPD